MTGQFGKNLYNIQIKDDLSSYYCNFEISSCDEADDRIGHISHNSFSKEFNVWVAAFSYQEALFKAIKMMEGTNEER